MTRDVPHAAGVEHVVDTFADQGVELDHHGLRSSACCAERARSCGCAARRRPRAACCSARSCTIRSSACTVAMSWAWMRRSSLARSASRDVGRRADDVLRQTQGIQGGLGLALVEQSAGVLDALLDVVGQLLSGDVLGRLGLLDGRLGIRRRWGRRRRRGRVRRRLVLAAAAPAGSCMATANDGAI